MHRVSTVETLMAVGLCLLFAASVAIFCRQVDLIEKVNQQTIKIKDMNDKLKVLTLGKEGCGEK